MPNNDLSPDEYEAHCFNYQLLVLGEIQGAVTHGFPATGEAPLAPIDSARGAGLLFSADVIERYAAHYLQQTAIHDRELCRRFLAALLGESVAQAIALPFRDVTTPQNVADRWAAKVRLGVDIGDGAMPDRLN